MAVKILYTRRFIKNFRKRISPNINLSKRFDQRIFAFSNNPKDPILKDHRLIGSSSDLRAFSITGDIRVVYRQITDKVVMFIDVGSHNQVY